MNVLTVPKLAVSTEEEAVAAVNRWLHKEIGLAVHATAAEFKRTNFCWHLPIELAYAAHGKLGVIGDVYLHAATGEFIGQPATDDLKERAGFLAKSFGIK